MSTVFAFVRHGQTDANAEGLYAGRLDHDLNELGVEQAQRLACEIGKNIYDILLYGTSRRVTHTAEILLDGLAVKPCIVERNVTIREMDFGLFEGHTWRQIAQNYPDEWRAYMEGWQQFCFPDGDCLTVFYEACAEFIQDAAARYQNRNILVVASKGFILCCVACLKRLERKDLFQTSISNGGLVTLSL